jgi:hypothetical protein
MEGLCLPSLCPLLRACESTFKVTVIVIVVIVVVVVVAVVVVVVVVLVVVVRSLVARFKKLLLVHIGSTWCYFYTCKTATAMMNLMSIGLF